MTPNREKQPIELGGTVVVEGGDKHPHALQRLKTSLPHIEWVEDQRDDSKPNQILSLEQSSSLSEGSFDISLTTDSHGIRVEVSGGPFSGVIYGVEALLSAVTVGPSGIAQFDAPVGVVSPDLPYRSFWTWDHSTNWNLDQVGHQEIGVFNSYGKPPEGFLSDYRRVVDFCSQHRIGGVVVYGFLRDSHGGVEAARELCKYANERGVRIIPGIAIGAYGGVYWEGPNQYNLSTWLKSRPGTEARSEGAIGFQIEDLDFPLNFPHSDYTKVACPSDPATMSWMEDAVSWLSETFDIGGVNIESGDYGVCGCDRCIARRGDRDDPSKRQEMLESWSHADLTDNFPRLFEAIRKNRPDAWVYCELQWDNLLDKDSRRAFDSMPDGAIYQHTVNRSYWERARRELPRGDMASFPRTDNALRTHIASQWSGDARTERYRNNSRDIMGLAKDSWALGFNGLTIWGEASPHHVPVELGYLAFSRFGFDTGLEWDQFFGETVAPLFGGVDEAKGFFALLDDIDRDLYPAVEDMARTSSQALSHLKEATDATAGRWAWLAGHATKRYRMAQDNNAWK